jgi:hypothetical protein
MSKDPRYPRGLTPAERRERRRAELKAWIAGSLKVQRRVWIALPIGALTAIVCAIVVPIAVPFAVLLGLSFWGVGRYITAAHIADWRLELESLDRPPAAIDGREPD